MVPDPIATQPEQEFEFVLPPGMTMADFAAMQEHPEGEPPSDETPAGTPEGSVATASVPAEEAPKPADRGLLKDLKKERRARQLARAELDGLHAENERLREETRRIDRAPKVVTLRPVKFDAAVRGQVKHQFLTTDAAELPEDFRQPVTKLVDRIFDAVENGLNSARQQDGAALTEATRPIEEPVQDRVNRLEAEFVAQGHEDYMDVLARAGFIGQGGLFSTDPATGLPRNVALHRRVFSSPNPPAKAYELAQAALEDDDEPAPQVEPAKPPARAVTPAPRSVETNGSVPAETRPVVPATTEAPLYAVPPGTDRSRSFRTLPSAGAPPRGRMSGRQLKQLMHADYDGFRKLMDANPDLELAFYSGDLAGT